MSSSHTASGAFAEHVSKNPFAFFRWACLIRAKYRRIWGEPLTDEDVSK